MEETISAAPCAAFITAACRKCLCAVNLSELLVFLSGAAVVFSHSRSIWGGGRADTFVSSYPTHAGRSIYLPSGAENAVSVNGSIFVFAGWGPVSCNLRHVSLLWEWCVVTLNVGGGDFDIIDGGRGLCVESGDFTGGYSWSGAVTPSVQLAEELQLM